MQCVLWNTHFLFHFLQLRIHEKKEVSGKEQWAELEQEEEEADVLEDSGSEVSSEEESDDWTIIMRDITPSSLH